MFIAFVTSNPFVLDEIVMFRTIIAHFNAPKFAAGARRKTPSDEHKMRQLSRMKASWASLLAPHVALGAKSLSLQEPCAL